jgi:hypothetical protein
MIDFLVSLDHEAFSKKPKPDQAARISNRVAKKQSYVTLESLAEHLSMGKSWCPATFTGSKRTIQTFEQQQLLIADVDDTELELEDLLSCWDHPPNIVHESFSSSSTQRKYRLIFALDDPLFVAEEVKLVTRHIAQAYNSDLAVAEGSRLIYGTNKPCTVSHQGSIKKADILKEAGRAYRRVSAGDKRKCTVSPLSATDLPTLFKQLSFLPKEQRTILKYSISDAREWIADPTIKGSRYQSVFLAGVHLALCSFLPDWLIELVIIQEIEDHDHFKGWGHDANEVITRAIEWGRTLDPRC